MILVTPFVSFLVVAFIVLAVAAGAASLAILTEFVATNRKARLARHESVGTYYRGLALTH